MKELYPEFSNQESNFDINGEDEMLINNIGDG